MSAVKSVPLSELCLIHVHTWHGRIDEKFRHIEYSLLDGCTVLSAWIYLCRMVGFAIGCVLLLPPITWFVSSIAFWIISSFPPLIKLFCNGSNDGVLFLVFLCCFNCECSFEIEEIFLSRFAIWIVNQVHFAPTSVRFCFHWYNCSGFGGRLNVQQKYFKYKFALLLINFKIFGEE